MKYVVGFLFDSKMRGVVLIQKTKPDWQKGKLNGVGGKVEEGETFLDAMVREFREEAGMEITDWEPFCRLTFPAGEVQFFYTTRHITEIEIESKTEEEVSLYSVDELMHWHSPDVIPNVRWLLQMARSFSYGEGCDAFEVKEVIGGE